MHETVIAGYDKYSVTPIVRPAATIQSYIGVGLMRGHKELLLQY